MSMISIGLAVFGYVALTKLPLNLLPDMSYPTLTLETSYPGAAPQEVEYLVTRPIEEAVAVIANVKRISSVSKPELSQVTMEFEWDRQMDFAILDVSKKLDLLRFPEDVEKPRILRYDPNEDPIVKVSVTGNMPLTELRFFGEEELKKRLESIPGLASVQIQGGLEETVEVRLDEAALKRFNLTIDQVTRRIQAENINRAGGSLYEREARYLVRTMNEFETLQDIGETIVSREGDRKIRLSEVASVERSHKDREEISRLNGQEGIELAFFKEGDANTVMVSRGIKQRLTELKERFKDDLTFETTYEGAVFIENAIEEVRNNAIVGGLMAILVLWLFLRNLRSTLIVALSIPISVFVCFFVMMQFGVSLNIMSLGGLALGIGMLVDSSIVVLESVFAKSQMGLSPLESAEQGAGEVSGAVVASTLTTVVVFLPIVFVEGVGGQLFRDLGLTVSFSLLASLAVSVTLIPTFYALWQPRRQRSTPVMIQERPAPQFFSQVMVGILRWRVGVLAAAALLLGATVTLWQSLGINLVPEMTQKDYFLLLELEEGTPILKTNEVAARVENHMMGLAGVERVYTTIGLFDQGVESRKGENLGQLNFTLDLSKGDPEDTLDQIRSFLGEDVNYRLGVPSFFSFKTPIEIELFCDDQTLLEDLTHQLTQEVAQTGFLKDVQNSISRGNPEIVIRFKRDMMSKMNLSIGDISQAIKDKIQGATPTQFVRDGRDIDIMVRLHESDRQNEENLQNLTVAYRDRKPIFLRSVAELITTTGPSQLRRIDQRKAALITAGIVGEDLGAVTEALAPIIDRVRATYTQKNQSVQVSLSGQNQEMEESFGSLFFAIALAVFLVYLVMASQFESLFHPFLIMFAIPLGLFGGLLGLKLMNLELSVIAMIGLVMLSGIVVNNAIVLIDHINQRRKHLGEDMVTAVIQGAFRRMRPILMTTATTVLGLFPMALGLGEGAELRTPLAITVIGGLSFSTLLTLVLMPVLYATFSRETAKALKQWNEKQP
jgi:HAE1 family hydrophobic/amphiphilic exporter-1